VFQSDQILFPFEVFGEADHMFFELLFSIGRASEPIFQVLDLFLELDHLVFLLAEQARVVQHSLALRVLHRIIDASLH